MEGNVVLLRAGDQNYVGPEPSFPEGLGTIDKILSLSEPQFSHQ